ncbi:MAG: hypothetical protein P8186_14050 [Anaerolineae bacterium]
MRKHDLREGVRLTKCSTTKVAASWVDNWGKGIAAGKSVGQMPEAPREPGWLVQKRYVTSRSIYGPQRRHRPVPPLRLSTLALGSFL